MVQEQVHQVSLNGLESFIEASPDYELAPIGLGSMREQAEKLAEYGRYGDIYVVHAAEGETVVPMEVLEANPKIKSLLFDQMSQMGLDPERYVVGNNLNSLNPVTGMPEFFFKKLWKSVKKFMPVIAPIVGNMIAPGIGGLIATGLTTKLSGGSWGDALKATAIAYGTQAVYQGLSGMGGKDGSFMKGFGEGLTAPYKATLGAVTGGRKYANPFEQGIFGSGDEIFPIYDPTYGAAPDGSTYSGGASAGDGDVLIPVPANSGADQRPFETWVGEKKAQLGRDLSSGELYNELNKFDAQQVRLEAKQLAAANADKGPLLGKYSPSKFLGLSEEGSDVADLGLGLGATYLLGGFDADEPEQPTRQQLAGVVPTQTGADLLAEDPGKYSIGPNLDPYANIPSLDVEVETTFPYPMYGAHGGTVNYPRQMGYINGPGTGTSDSIPAMLSNGEFVMTKRAVDGAGGPGTMYDLMRNFEMRA